MPVFFAVIGTPLYDFAAGCVLGANVYLMVRGGKNNKTFFFFAACAILYVSTCRGKCRTRSGHNEHAARMPACQQNDPDTSFRPQKKPY